MKSWEFKELFLNSWNTELMKWWWNTKSKKFNLYLFYFVVFTFTDSRSWCGSNKDPTNKKHLELLVTGKHSCIGNYLWLESKQTELFWFLLTPSLNSVCPRYFWTESNKMIANSTYHLLFPLQHKRLLIKKVLSFLCREWTDTNEHFILSKGLSNVSSF